MSRNLRRTVEVLAAAIGMTTAPAWLHAEQGGRATSAEVKLPKPNTSSGMSLPEALARRRTHRAISDRPLTLEQIGQVCWAAQGVTEPTKGLRTAPSAGALYPVAVYVLKGDGVFEYVPKRHTLRRLKAGDVRSEPKAGPLGKKPVRSAPVCLVLAMDPSRTAKRWPEEAERYALLEAGHIAQNVLLQATALGLVSVPVGGADEGAVAAALKLPKGQRAVYLLPVGYAAANPDARPKR